MSLLYSTIQGSGTPMNIDPFAVQTCRYDLMHSGQTQNSILSITPMDILLPYSQPVTNEANQLKTAVCSNHCTLTPIFLKFQTLPYMEIAVLMQDLSLAHSRPSLAGRGSSTPD